jgi:carbon-monoxide dehydrogenase small subunit
MKLKISLNKKMTTLEISASQTLAKVLNDNGLTSVKQGCETGDCGSCTVLVNDRAVQSCIMLAAQVEGKAIQTFESIEHTSKHRPLYNHFLDTTDRDCGFCIPGLMMSIEAILKYGALPDVSQIQDALAGNACHCNLNAKKPEAVLTAVKKTQGDY